MLLFAGKFAVEELPIVELSAVLAFPRFVILGTAVVDVLPAVERLVVLKVDESVPDEIMVMGAGELVVGKSVELAEVAVLILLLVRGATELLFMRLAPGDGWVLIEALGLELDVLLRRVGLDVEYGELVLKLVATEALITAVVGMLVTPLPEPRLPKEFVKLNSWLEATGADEFVCEDGELELVPRLQVWLLRLDE